MSRYPLTEYSTAKSEPCSHKERIPGLDASICPRCQLVWRNSLSSNSSPPPLPLKDVFTGSLSNATKPGDLQPPVTFIPDFYARNKASLLFDWSNDLRWQRNSMSMHGKSVAIPRDELMFGNGDETYRYKDVLLFARPLPPFLTDMKKQVERKAKYRFSVVIGNRYQSGKDSIGFHADDSPEIGPNPAIASISLGATRRFKLRHKRSGQTFDYELTAGSLLIMHPGCQEEWVHSVPKTAKSVGPRINWTFRPYVRKKK